MTAPHTGAPHLPVPPEPARGTLAPARSPHRTGAGTVVALVVLGPLVLVAIAVVGYLVGPDALPAAAVLALVPLAGVLAAVAWVDRWEPEPWPALAVAFGWGASVAVLVSLVLNTGALAVLVAVGADETGATAWAASVVAPVVEESIKGLGVLIVFFGWRRFFDGPVDGVVYAATVAAGFAFVENVLYFGTVIADPGHGMDQGAAVATVFVLRAVLSPFAHVLFTACVGLALGVAARRRGGAWVVAFPLGLVPAVLLHGLWNASATFGTGTGFLVLYVVVQVPLFLGCVVLVLWLRRREAAIVRQHLEEYAAAWWFTPQEVHMLSSLGQRRRARSWAAGRGGRRAGRAMREFQTLATRLAYHRHRAVIQRSELWRARQDEAALLRELGRTRQDLQRSLAV